MHSAINLSDLPVVEVSPGAGLGIEIGNLPHGADAKLRYGRLRIAGAGTTVSPAVILAIVNSGTMTAIFRDTVMNFSAGDVVAIGSGSEFHLNADNAILSVICHFGVVDEPYFRAIDLAHPLLPSAPPDVTLLRSPVPACSKVTFSDADAFSYGIWLGTPYHRIASAKDKTEFMHILEGAVTSFTSDGSSQRFEKGDTFIAPQGVALGWNSDVPVRKIWMLSRGA